MPDEHAEALEELAGNRALSVLASEASRKNILSVSENNLALADANRASADLLHARARLRREMVSMVRPAVWTLIGCGAALTVDLIVRWH